MQKIFSVVIGIGISLCKHLPTPEKPVQVGVHCAALVCEKIIIKTSPLIPHFIHHFK